MKERTGIVLFRGRASSRYMSMSTRRHNFDGVKKRDIVLFDEGVLNGKCHLSYVLHWDFIHAYFGRVCCRIRHTSPELYLVLLSLMDL